MNIGKNIVDLRKAKGITQEALAAVVGVSAQAVSKWESGGSPDIELLPAIAHYFEISIDQLFDHQASSFGNIQTEMVNSITAIPNMDERLDKVFDYCWLLEQAIWGGFPVDFELTVDDIAEKNSQNTFSQMILDNGFTLVGFNKNLRHYLIMPEPPDGWKQELYYKDEFRDFFELLSDESTLKTIFFLYGRKAGSFTPKLLEKELSIAGEKALTILNKLISLKLIDASQVELDDEIKTVYRFEPNVAIIPFLMFAREIIKRPNSFYMYAQNRKETNPLLK